MRRATLSALVASMTLGCAPTPVEVDLAFPSRDTFLYSEFARLLVYEVDLESPESDCPALIEGLMDDQVGDPILDTDFTEICGFRDPGVSFDSIPPGPHAYVVVARDDSSTILLTGCTVAEAFEGAPPVRVRMFPTTEYEGATSGRALSCANEEQKCRSGC